MRRPLEETRVRVYGDGGGEREGGVLIGTAEGLRGGVVGCSEPLARGGEVGGALLLRALFKSGEVRGVEPAAASRGVFSSCEKRRFPPLAYLPKVGSLTLERVV